MREVLSAKDKREAIKRYISLNPELSNRRIARYWDVHHSTIAEYRSAIGGGNPPKKGDKMADFRHHETENLPVVTVRDIPYDGEKIRDAMMVLLDKITELEKATHYLKNFFPHQIIDAIQTTSYINGLEFFEDGLTQTSKLYRALVNERNAGFEPYLDTKS